MSESDRVAALESRLQSLETRFQTYAAARHHVFDDIQELFREFAKAMDVVSAGLEELTPLDEMMLDSDSTGVMGRAFELQALTGIFRKNLSDLDEKLKTIRLASS